MPININANSVYEILGTITDGNLPKAYHMMYEHLEGKVSYEKCVALVDTIKGYSPPNVEKQIIHRSDIVRMLFYIQSNKPYSAIGYLETIIAGQQMHTAPYIIYGVKVQ